MLMADERLIAPMRRFWTKENVQETYQKVFEANLARIEKVTVIIGKGNEGESANAQVVVSREDYLEMMSACEARLKELDQEAGGGNTLESTEHVNLGGRFVRS